MIKLFKAIGITWIVISMLYSFMDFFGIKGIPWAFAPPLLFVGYPLICIIFVLSIILLVWFSFRERTWYKVEATFEAVIINMIAVYLIFAYPWWRT